jgi:hypothetical protein
LSLRGKMVSSVYAALYARLQRDGAQGLNFPAMHAWLVGAWCDCMVAGDDDVMHPHFTKARDFTRRMIEASNVQSGYGFPLWLGGPGGHADL